MTSEDYLDKFLGMTKKLSIKLQVQYLISYMKFTHQTIKDRKSTMLNHYINYCAIKIQKVYRGHRSRKLDLPIRNRLGKEGVTKLKAIIQGWRIRRIFKTKECKTKIK